MNIKLQLSEVRLLIDKRFPIEQISSQLQPIAKQANLMFAEHQVGAGYLQWSLPGKDWNAFPNGSDDQKSIVAQLYKERKAQMQSLLQGSFLKDVIFSVPSEDFIFFHQDGDKWEIALTAWGYKYPDKPASGELDTWISKQDLQNVKIAFAWADQYLPDFSFKLSGHTRITSPDGFMHIDGPLPVGNSYQIETFTGNSFNLTVEKGKSDYIFDLTQYFQVEVVVNKDDNPLQNCICDIHFGDCHNLATTELSGRSVIKIPLLSDSFGQAAIPQPPCIVTCDAEIQQQTPSNNGDVLSFAFNFKTETPKPPIEESPVLLDKHIRVKVEVFRDGKPVKGQTNKVLFEGESHLIITDEQGEAYFESVLKVNESGDNSGNQPICEVICEDLHQSKALQKDVTDFVFHFDLSPKEDTPKEPEYVYIQLKDYSGMPLIEMPFTLTTKKKGRSQLQTDHEGRCKLPKEWFSSKERIKIDFSVSPEYQRTHDIHYHKNKKK